MRSAFIILTFAAGCSIADAAEVCDLNPVVRSLNAAKWGEYEVRSVSMSFEPTVVYIPLENGTMHAKDVALPSLSIRLDANAHPARVSGTVRALADQMSGFDKSVSTNPVAVQGNTAVITGGLHVEKWAKIDGFECTWKQEWWGGYPECRRTEWKTRLWEHTFDWHSNTAVRVSKSNIGGTRPNPLYAIGSRQPFDEIVDSEVASSGKLDTHISNDFERLLADALFWFSSALNGTFDKFNLEPAIPDLEANDVVALDARSKLYPPESSVLYRDENLAVGREGYRGLWQIFVDTLQFDEGESGYSLDGNGLGLDLVV